MDRLVILRKLIVTESLVICLLEVSHCLDLWNLSPDFGRPTHSVEHGLQV